MPDFITLSCPTCGGKLQLTNDIERFACAHCGNEHIVRRGGGIVSLAPVVDGLNRVQAGIDKTASELAIGRLRQEIGLLQQRFAETNRSMFLWQTETFPQLKPGANRTKPSQPTVPPLPLAREAVIALLLKDTPGANPAIQEANRYSD